MLPTRLTLIALVSGMLIAPRAVTAQSAQDEVLATMQAFFDAVAARDSTTLKELLLEEGYFQPLVDTAIGPARRMRQWDYVRRIVSAPQVFGEQQFDPEVRVDDKLAVVWARYAATANGSFTHCGTNAFTLVRTPVGWRIAGAAYTIQRQNCREASRLR